MLMLDMNELVLYRNIIQILIFKKYVKLKTETTSTTNEYIAKVS